MKWYSAVDRSGAPVAPSVILKSKSLLLRNDGTVLGPDGLPPSFDPQSSPVRLVVKRRNHLPVMSTSITNFTGSKTYNFTSAPGQAFNDGTAPAQMRQVGGNWCMRTADVATPRTTLWTVWMERTSPMHLMQGYSMSTLLRI
ncbi:hypothetical protein [Dyadobacter beijingensis]|uniref:hypothetical protein n=1 Tax=Dyadobacter beijingensis TaxID=365489 RepID=UPI0004770F64|nr:hypothetical protein [Dyadobacter beijingensis]